MSDVKKILQIKNIVAIILCFLLIVSPFLYSSEAYGAVNNNDKLYGESLTERGVKIASCPTLDAKYAVLMDKKGQLIYERDSYTHTKIASLTKIMTAIVALENCELSEKLKINKEAVEIGESSAGFWEGDELTVDSALYALMVPSGNDAAEALCEYVGQKLVNSKDSRIAIKSNDENNSEEVSYITDKDEAFCKIMNDTAKKIECNDTNFTNPHGLDDEKFYNESQYSCAADMAKITRYAMENQKFRSIVGGGSTEINVVRNGQTISLPLATTDILLESYSGCLGVKTGKTDTAGACFSGAVTDTSNVEVYSIVLKSSDETQRFIDTQNLWNWYYTNKVDYKIANSPEKESMTVGDSTKEVDVIAKIGHSEWASSTIPVALENNNMTVPILSVAGNVYQSVEPEEASGNFKAGDVVGSLVFKQHNNEVQRVNLIAIKDQPTPNIFQMVGVGFDRLIKLFTGQPMDAPTELVNEPRSFE